MTDIFLRFFDPKTRDEFLKRVYPDSSIIHSQLLVP